MASRLEAVIFNLGPKNTSVICPHNDAESYTISDIAKRCGFDIRISAQSTWFCPLDKEPEETFQNLKTNVVVIEMPSIAKEAELKDKGYNVFIVDHHDYPSFHLDRDNEKGSLEQFAELIGYTLSEREKGISINDQHYIYGLFSAQYSTEEIQKIRKLDLKCQGYTEEELTMAETDFQNPEELNKTTTLYHSQTTRYSYLTDLHVLSKKGEFSNVVILGNTKDKGGRFVFFSGEMSVIYKLKKLGGYSKKSNHDYGLWGGHELGDERVHIATALSIIEQGSI